MTLGVHYAVGDVHGRDDLLAEIHGQIQDHHRRRHAGRPGTVVHLGDLVDRGPDSRAALDRVRAGLPGLSVRCLMGNHEEMLLRALDRADSWAAWTRAIGRETLASFGLTPDCPQRAFAEALGPGRHAWLRALPTVHRAGGWVFVHAGLAPGVPLADQDPKTMRWIRGPFLDSTADHGAIVVHGHTPSAEVEIRPNRIGCDLGSEATGRLAAVVLEPGAPPRVLRAEGAPT